MVLSDDCKLTGQSMSLYIFCSCLRDDFVDVKMTSY